tara:strand:- start:3207 stop:4517 length:1311 start_codon:yes stop_codon:yes gene_type:complete
VRNVIVGFGKTGVSVAEHCLRQGILFAVADDAAEPTRLKDFESDQQKVTFAPLDQFEFTAEDRLVVSPGVPLTHPVLQRAAASGLELTNDIKLFCELRQQPLALITGSNGKSTVTHFVGQLLNGTNIKTGVGGNIGTPALSLLVDDYGAYVLEVSSYQLELANNAAVDVAVLLNLSPDHLDRYPSLEDYYRTKTGVFSGCTTAIFGRDIEFDLGIPASANVVTFGSDEPSNNNCYGIREISGQTFLARGNDNLTSVDKLSLKGRHNWLNLLAAIAVADAMGAQIEDLVTILPSVTGLPHRCEVVKTDRALVVNDSKSTNPSSTLTAIQGFADPGSEITLILGGMGKGADFTVLDPAIRDHVQRCYVYGRDRKLIADAISSSVVQFETLEDCLLDIVAKCDSSDLILFSPGCASLDQYSNFEARGDYFRTRIQELFV